MLMRGFLGTGFRRRRPRPGDKWHLDEMVIRMNGVQHYLWRAVDQRGVCLGVLVTRRRDMYAARKFLRKLLKSQEYTPRVLITDKLRSYGAAKREVMASVEHRQSTSARSIRPNGSLVSEFARRNLDLPTHFTVPDPNQWTPGYEEEARRSILPSATTLSEAMAAVGAFTDPILCDSAIGVWDPRRARWAKA